MRVGLCKQVRKDNPGISFGDLSKTIGNLWKEMDPEDKERFLSLEREDKERYQDAMTEYRRVAGLPDKPAKRRRSGATSAATAHLRSIDDLVDNQDEDLEDSDGGMGKKHCFSLDIGASRKASLNSSSRKTSARPKRRGIQDPVDWVQCDDCGSWRFFDPGLDPTIVGSNWKCSENERECGKFVVEEDFMRNWTQLMGSDTQQSLYKFVLEGQMFTVYDLYWSVMSLGGYNAVSKWKDVGNDMMWRKLQCLVSKAPGKNYSLLKNQWDRWNLSKYQEKYPDKPVPDPYLSPAVDPKNIEASVAASASAGTRSPSQLEASSPSVPLTLSTKREINTPAWRGRQMWPRTEEEKTPKLSRSPVQFNGPSPVQLSEHTASLASLEQSLPPIPVHPPLPALPDLTYDEKLELRLQKSMSYVRGLRKEDVAASREHWRAWRSRVEAVRFRSEPLGQDRYHRRYWILSDDFSRIWVEKSDYKQRDHVVWGCYNTLQQVEPL